MRRAVLSAASKDFFSRKLPSPSSTAQPRAAQLAGQRQRGGVQASPSGATYASATCGGAAFWTSSWACSVSTSRSKPDGEADPRRLGPADRLAQPVVAPAAEQRVLRAQPAVRELEGRARVVVEAAHQPRIQRVRHAGGIQRRRHLRKVRSSTPHRANRRSSAACR